MAQTPGSFSRVYIGRHPSTPRYLRIQSLCTLTEKGGTTVVYPVEEFESTDLEGTLKLLINSLEPIKSKVSQPTDHTGPI